MVAQQNPLTHAARRLLRWSSLTPQARWAVGLGAIMLAFMAPGLIELASLSLKQYQLDHQLAQLNAQEQALLTEQERLQHDPVYVEGLIRSTFKYAKPGELVIPLDAADSH